MELFRLVSCFLQGGKLKKQRRLKKKERKKKREKKKKNGRFTV